MFTIAEDIKKVIDVGKPLPPNIVKGKEDEFDFSLKNNRRS